MRIENYYLTATLIILFISNNLCLAQENRETDAPQQIVAKSTYLPFKTVKDRYGKKFAQSYFVIQIDIRNEKLDKQFIVQTLDVLFDRRQCQFAQRVDESFNRTECERLFDKFFYFTNAKQPVGRDDVIATGEADLNRSNRNVGFRLLAFSANIGSILTGFNGVLGPDGIKGINVLGTTFTSAANALFPNTADQKFENLRNALPTEDVIIKSKESQTFNIFIPTERVFWQDSWKEYIKPTRDSDYDVYKFKLVLEMIMLSSASGVLVNNDAQKVQVRSDDSFRRQEEKFRLVAESTDEEIQRADLFQATLVLLQNNLASVNARVNRDATDKLRAILTRLNLETRFSTFLTTSPRNITAGSTGAEILQGIKELMRNINDEDLENKVMNVVIQEGR